MSPRRHALIPLMLLLLNVTMMSCRTRRRLRFFIARHFTKTLNARPPPVMSVCLHRAPVRVVDMQTTTTTTCMINVCRRFLPIELGPYWSVFDSDSSFMRPPHGVFSSGLMLELDNAVNDVKLRCSRLSSINLRTTRTRYYRYVNADVISGQLIDWFAYCHPAIHPCLLSRISHYSYSPSLPLCSGFLLLIWYFVDLILRCVTEIRSDKLYTPSVKKHPRRLLAVSLIILLTHSQYIQQ